MSTEVLFYTAEHRLTNKSVTKQKSMKVGFDKTADETVLKNENSFFEAQGSAPEKTKSSLTQSLNRKINYQIQLESNEIIIQVLNGETGEVIREIPQQDFIRLVDRVSEFSRNMISEVA